MITKCKVTKLQVILLMSKMYPYLVLFKILITFRINEKRIVCFCDDNQTPITINNICEVLVVNTKRFKKILKVLKPFIKETRINNKRYLKINSEIYEIINKSHIITMYLSMYVPLATKECRNISKGFRK